MNTKIFLLAAVFILGSLAQSHSNQVSDYRLEATGSNGAASLPQFDLYLKSNRIGWREVKSLTRPAFFEKSSRQGKGQGNDDKPWVKFVEEVTLAGALVTGEIRQLDTEEAEEIRETRVTLQQSNADGVCRTEANRQHELLDRTFDDPHDRNDTMISGLSIAPTTPLVSLEKFKAIIDANPEAKRLVVEKKVGSSSLTAQSSIYGATLRFIFGETEDRNTRQVLRDGIRQRYGSKVAEIAFPTINDGSCLTANEAAGILNMASMVHENISAYDTPRTTDETMRVIAYARDAALVAREAATKALEARNAAKALHKKGSVSGPKKAAALVAYNNDPAFVTARTNAAKATLHASQAAEAAQRAIQKVVGTDSSYGATTALAAARLHVDASREAIVTTGEEVHIEKQATEALWSAMDAHDAYEAYTDAKTAAATGSLPSRAKDALAREAAIRKESLTKAIEDMEAAVVYAKSIAENVSTLSGLMATFGYPSDSVSVGIAGRNIALSAEYAVTIIERTRAFLAVGEDSSLIASTSDQHSAADEFCRAAAAKRMIAAAERAITAIETTATKAIETIETIETMRKSYFTWHRESGDTILASINSAQLAYRNHHNVNVSTTK